MNITQERVIMAARILVWILAIAAAVATVYYESHKHDPDSWVYQKRYIAFGGTFFPPDMVPHMPIVRPPQPNPDPIIA